MIKYSIVAFSLVLVLLYTTGCATLTDQLVQWRYGTPPPTIDLEAIAAEQGDVQPLPTVPPTATIPPTRTPPPLPTLAATVAPTATPIPQIVTYEDQEGRFTLRYPDNWLVNDEDTGAIFLASDEQILTTNNLEEGGILFLFPGEANVLEEPDPAGVLQLFIENYVVFDAEELLQGVSTTTLNGRTVAQAQAAAVFNRYPVQVTYTAFVENSRFMVVVMMLAEETAADVRPTAAAIVESIQLR